MKEMNRKEFLKLAVKGTAAAAVLSALPSTLTAYADEGEKLYILPRPRKLAASTAKHSAHSFWISSLPISTA